jgi:Protein of unknown function (DUF1553)/Protein of unknown function (DUF1549)/Planctomycete cytochrome C
MVARIKFGWSWAVVSLTWLQTATLPAAQLSEEAAVSILQRKCLQCHGETLQMSGLDLRTREALLKGGDKGPAIVPGNAEASRAYRRVAGMEQPLMPMTPLPPLSSEEITVLKSWINQGAKWDSGKAATQPSTAPTPLDPKTQNKISVAGGYGKDYQERPTTEQDRKWWAFQKPVRPLIPKVADTRRNKHPIDAFVKKTLDEKGLAPAPQADRNTLIRRATLDLIGLLPTTQDVEAFANDPSPRAYENLIERLLSSSHYGERWGRFWLDVVRYADSSGFEHDKDLANAWRYRDYVIKAFNQDKPFDRFILEQLAGDELGDRNFDSLTATSYYRIGPRVRFREKDNPYYRYEYLDDIIRTTFQGFMGLSVNCARCHDHKFDPISRKDYYRTMAMLFGYVDIDHPLAPPDKVAEYEKIKKEVDEQTRPLRRKIAQIEAPYRRAAFEKRLAKFPEEIQIAVRTPDAQRTPGQKLLAAQIVSLDVDPDAAANQLSNYRSMMSVSEADHEVRQKLVEQIEEIQKRLPDPLPVAEGVRDGDYRLTPDGPGDEPLPGKGDRFDYGVQCCFLPESGKPFEVPPVYFGANGMDVTEDQKSFVVEPGYLKVLAGSTSLPIADAPGGNGYVTSGRRRALAKWIASPDNPLTARVIVNRVWHWHFGRGIVPTPGNFGKMGMPPSHPQLLDWLATEFVRQKWSLKQMHRLVMTSEAYKMASSFALPANLEKDPTNVALWRFPLRRLEGEAIRDIILSASGQLNLEAAGPPFFPSIPKALRESYRAGKWELTKEEPSNWRRSVYSYWKRGLKYPMFEVHDQPDPNVTCERRNTTTVPTQALTLSNNEFVLMQARYFAERVMRDAGDGTEQQIQGLYRVALSRAPDQEELKSALSFVQKQREYHLKREPASGSEASSTSGVELAALTDLAHVMLNSNEFVYIN